MAQFTVRPAITADASEMARIYNEGIAERVATFETREKTADELAALVESGALALVAEKEGSVVAFVKVGPYDDASHYYAGIGEATLYVDPHARRSGRARPDGGRRRRRRAARLLQTRRQDLHLELGEHR